MTAPQAQQAFLQGVTINGPTTYSPRKSDFEIYRELRLLEWAALEPGTQGNLFAYTPMPLQPSRRAIIDVDVPPACEGAVDDWYDALQATEQPKPPVSVVSFHPLPVRPKRRVTKSGAAIAVAVVAFVLVAMQHDSQSGDTIAMEAPLLEKQDRLQKSMFERLRNRPFMR